MVFNYTVIARFRGVRNALTALALLLSVSCCAPAWPQDVTPVISTDHGANSAAALKQHYVILVSLDGFRYDYAKKYGAKNLQALAAAGATAPEGMIPAYPSLTFANHYTL